ncbi:hypothetical protein TG4357_00393 [Thalassovita gelatinovora]|uniref:Uncharacterized protein n=1 Tax=Thalassovita gelatinovora TaxID=53501 RepID=A0A0P1F5H3_THAGE|nr:hypothetical protein TG4357_00393 [Thalassovita gelatinovora]SEQ12990.1 hypothetical protein SAMN04488043_103293 [Thalassovita gelatinovora]
MERFRLRRAGQGGLSAPLSVQNARILNVYTPRGYFRTEEDEGRG